MDMFPDNFLWGASTSAYQIEGSPLADGAGPNIWHQFSRTPGRTAFGETGDIACDHYNRWRDDVALMASLGLQSYRFSIAWSRILPEGRGAVNQRGLDFYSRLVDALLEHNIVPNATLYHWDLPAALDQRGGWINPDIASWFADYADIMFRTLGDRVPMWATLNEPWVVADAGYVHGVHAPGHRNLFEAAHVAHNLLRAHGSAVQVCRATLPNVQIGIVVNLEPKYPASDNPADLAALQRADAYFNRQYLDPVFLGEYPEELAGIFGEAWFERSSEDMALIRQPIDFVGINYYKREVTYHDPTAWPVFGRHLRQPQHQHTEMGWDWEVYPPALTRILTLVTERYGRVPLYITENGAAFYDPPKPVNGRVDDPLRITYLRDHLLAAHAAMQAGVDLRGYYAWSLFDNYEWSAGYEKRFGIVHIDFETLQRTPKQSARFYADVIRSNGAVLSASN